VQSLKSTPRALHEESRLKKKTLFFIYQFMALTWPQSPKKKKDALKLGRPICIPSGQCCDNKILLFCWNPHCKTKINLRSNSISFTSSSIHLLIFLFSCWAFVFFYEWWREFLFFFCLRYDFEKGTKDNKKNDIKNEWKHMKGWSFDPYFLDLMTLHMNSLAPKQIIFY
jgi:hypothetical protein